MKVKVKLENSSISNNLKTINNSFETAGILFNEDNYLRLVFSDSNNEKTSHAATFHGESLIYEIHDTDPIVINFKLHEETIYSIKVRYQELNVYIYTEELIVNDNFIYAKYYVKEDPDTIHQIMIRITNL